MADCGIASRRESEHLIQAGRVTVNGNLGKIGDSVQLDVDLVEVDGKPAGPQEKVYVLLNKPVGVITSAKDTHQRKTVLDCLGREMKARVYPVGRLDMDVEGALLLMNDGELAYRLMHPKYQIDKVYLVWVKGRVTTDTAVILEQGIELEDGLTAPASAVILNIGATTTQLRLVMREGRKREIKRMCAAVGHPVKSLQRICVANIKLNGLGPGEWRYLKAREIRDLRRLTRLSDSFHRRRRG